MALVAGFFIKSKQSGPFALGGVSMRLFKRKPDGVYWIDYFADGRRIRESTGTNNRKLAEQCLHSRLGDVVQGKFKLKDRSPSPYFREFSDKFLEWAKQNKRSWKRDWHSIQNLMPSFGHRRLSAIHPFHVESYKSSRKAEVKPATVNREVACLKRVLNLAVEWGVIGHNPISCVKLYKEPQTCVRFLTEEEAGRLVEACSEPFKWVVVTALHTGMRRNEILFLRWEHVNLREGFIAVTETKNDEIRYIPMNKTMTEMLNNIPRRGEFVFAQKNGRPYSWIGRAWRNAKANAGVECRFHDLRHTYASHLVMNGTDLPTIKELLGHKSLAMVERYSHLSPEHKRKAVETLDATFSGKDGTNMAHDRRNAVNVCALSG